MRVMLAGGGTAGHINPALAIAGFIRERKPDSEILFIGTEEGMEKTLVPKAGFDIRYVHVYGFQRKLSAYNFKALYHSVASIGEAGKIIDEFKPDVVIGTGGYVSWPVLFAAAGRKIPTAIHEQNAFPGVTSRMLARRVDRVMLSFPGSESFFAKKAVTSLVGNPIRSEIVFADKEKARAELQLDDRPYIYSVGGSLGARRMNEGIIELIALHAPRQEWQHCHATGRFGWKWVPGKLQEAGVQMENCPALDLREYVYNAPTVMAAADVVISRAGAITLCELQALGKPAILIPSPNVTNNHQYHNAKALADRGAAILIEEKDLSGQRLFDEIRALLADPERLHSMQEKAREMAICDSAQRIYDIVTELVRSKRNG